MVTGLGSPQWCAVTQIADCPPLDGSMNAIFRGSRMRFFEGAVRGICKDRNPGGKGEGSWCIDHDHSCCPGINSCGKCVRALLCHNCNTTLGRVGDDPEILQAMIAYLDKYATIRRLEVS